jgi:hypothetical protein
VALVKKDGSWVSWCTPVVIATWEVEREGSQFKAAKVHQTLFQREAGNGGAFPQSQLLKRHR